MVRRRRRSAVLLFSASLLVSLLPAATIPSAAHANTAAQPVEPGAYQSLPPTRILDTRVGLGAPRQSVPGNHPIEVQLSGRGGVPTTGVAAVAVNVTVTQPTAAGVLTIYPGSAPVPNTSTLNFLRAQTVANLAVIQLGTDGAIAALPRTPGRVQLIMDVQGYYLAGAAQTQGAFVAIAPIRLIDTRTGLGGIRGPLIAGYDASATFMKRPAAAVAVVANVTVTSATGAGYLTTARSYPSSILNFSRGRTVANLAVIDTYFDDVLVTVRGSGSVQVIIDVYGYYVAGPRPGFISKDGTLGSVWERALDTRSGTGGYRGAVRGGTTLAVATPTHPFGPLSSINTVAVNLTVVSATGSGYLTAYPSGSRAPASSNINFSPGSVIANLSLVGVDPSGHFTIHFSGVGSIAVIVDVEAEVLGADIPPQTAGALAVSNVLTTSLSLNWQFPAYGGITGFLIRRAVGSTPPATPADGVQVAEITGPPWTAIPFEDTCLIASTTYSYSVFTEDGSAVSIPATLTVTTQPAPAPNGITAWGDASVDHPGNDYYSQTQCGHPEPIESLANVVQLASDFATDYALKSDGTVWGVGPGVATSTGFANVQIVSTDVPIEALPFQDVVQIAASNSVLYALRSDGTVWEVGDDVINSDGGYTAGGRLIQIPGLQGMVSIAASPGLWGRASAYGIKSDGTLWGWGTDNASQFPPADVDASCDCVRQPVQLFGFNDVTGVAIGLDNAYALHRDGTLSAWGSNFAGALGDGGNEASSAIPVSVSGIASATAVYASPNGDSAYAALSDGTVRSWGLNGVGQLGDGTTTNRNTPVVVNGLTSVRSIVASGGDLVGTGSALAVLTDGSVARWGFFDHETTGTPTVIPGLANVAALTGYSGAGFVYLDR